MAIVLSAFREVWLVDFEYGTATGGRPRPVCMVASECHTGTTLRLWEDELRKLRQPPFAIGKDCLVVAYFSSAEWGCFLSLGWDLPVNALDLFVEFRAMRNSDQKPEEGEYSLIGAMTHYGLDTIDAVKKDYWRDLAMRGPTAPWPPELKAGLLVYCEFDVTALRKLLPMMVEDINQQMAQFHGRYMRAVSRIESRGIPVDTGLLNFLMEHWGEIKLRTIEKGDANFGVYDLTHFRHEKFEQLITRNHWWQWPRTPHAKLLKHDAKTLEEMSLVYPKVEPLAKLITEVGELNLVKLAIGPDGRNRVMLSPFGARTSRNTPKSGKFIFGPSRWIRGLIKPRPGMAIAYVDWASEEVGIAAVLSGDRAMLEAYESGDVYLAFAIQAGLAPPDATKETHRAIRKCCKSCVLGIGYGMGVPRLAARTGLKLPEARDLYRRHRQTYPVFWKWVAGAQNLAMLRGEISSRMGWVIRNNGDPNPRSLMNFPMQACGADLLRLVCIWGTERGIRICAPIHDALLVEAPIEEIDAEVARTVEVMDMASRFLLKGFTLRTEATIIRYPERYMDEDGKDTWDDIWATVEECFPGKAPMEK
ncbi:MAG: DNA polymerase [Candidatus Binataceae bacterium]